MSEPELIRFDVNDLDPASFARMLVSRAAGDDQMAWAEIHWDAGRYHDQPKLVMHLVGFTEQLLAALAAQQGKTSAQLWQEWMLAEAAEPRDGNDGTQT